MCVRQALASKPRRGVASLLPASAATLTSVSRRVVAEKERWQQIFYSARALTAAKQRSQLAAAKQRLQQRSAGSRYFIPRFSYQSSASI